METCGELGIAMGVATLGTAVTVIYRGLLPGVLPAGLALIGTALAARRVLGARAIPTSGELPAAATPDLVTAT